MPKKKKQQLITRTDKRKAATVLAYAGWQKGKRSPRGSVTAAARQAGVTLQTICEWCKDPDFQEAIEEISSEIISDCVQGLRKSAKGGNVTASIFLLKTLDPDRFDDSLRSAREKQRLANEGMQQAIKELPKINIKAADTGAADQHADKYALILDAINGSPN